MPRPAPPDATFAPLPPGWGPDELLRSHPLNDESQHRRPCDVLDALLDDASGEWQLAWNGPRWRAAGPSTAPESATAALMRMEAWLAQGVTYPSKAQAHAHAQSDTASRRRPLPILHDPQGQMAWRAADLLTRAAQAGAQGLIVDTSPPRACLLPHPLTLAAVPGLRSYSPALAAEASALLNHLNRCWKDGLPIGLVHLRLPPVPMPAPSLPRSFSGGMVRGLYQLQADPAERDVRLQLMASGCSLPTALDAALVLRERHGLAVDVWSVTSYALLASDAHALPSWWPQPDHGIPPHAATSDTGCARGDSWLSSQLRRSSGPILALADAPRLVADMLRPHMAPTRPYLTLGTDDLSPACAGLWTGRPAATDCVVQAGLALGGQVIQQREAERQQHLSTLVSMASI